MSDNKENAVGGILSAIDSELLIKEVEKKLFAIIHQNYFSTCDSIENFFQDAHVDLQITCKTVL